MTTETTTEPRNVRLARERAEAVRVAAGLPATRRVRGPVAEMMAEAGFSAARIRRTAECFATNFLTPGAIGIGVMHEGEVRAFVESFETVAAAVEAAA